MNPELLAALSQLATDANYRATVDRDIAKEAYDRYQVLAKEAKVSAQRSQNCEEALRLLRDPASCDPSHVW